jgi:hypothetical protein
MFAFALLLAVAAQAQSVPALYCSHRNADVSDGRVQIARQWQASFTEDFENGLGRWRVENYGGKLTIGTVQEETGKHLEVSAAGAVGDTAFEVASDPFPVRPGEHWRLRMALRATLSLATIGGHQGHYLTQVEWRNGAGEVLSATPFTLGAASKLWRETVLAGTVPPEALTGCVRIGFDQPNLSPGDSLSVDDVRFELRAEPARFEASAQVLSRPMRAAPGLSTVTWQAQAPEGTAVRLQVAAAEDRQGAPGRWSELMGPDGTAASFYTSPGPIPAALASRPWLRYQVTLETSDPARTPTLESVTVAGATDGPWSGPDTTPPQMVEGSATRTADASAPISFALSDETGLDIDSLALSLDGLDITPQLTREGSRFTYRPPQPLAPPPAERGFSGWRVMNHAGALTIERSARRVPGASPYCHITREAGEVDTAFSLQSPAIPVAPGAQYRLSYWLRHSADLGGAQSGSSIYSSGLTWQDATGATVGERVPIGLGAANPQWHHESREVIAPLEAATARVQFGLDYPNLYDGAFVDISEVELVGPHPARADDRPNLHRVSVQAADFAGNVLSRDWYRLIREPLTRGVVTLREDGAVLIDGAPFFPIGLYAVWKKPFNDNSFDKAFGDLQAAGFNTAHTYTNARGADFAEFYASAARHGIKLYLSSGAGANCRDVETVLWDVTREEAQPALLAWYLADDTASHVGADELRTIADAVRDVDPAHITVQADGVGDPSSSRYAAYVDATDGFLPELYPIRDDSGRGVPWIITDMQTVKADLERAHARQKTIWPIIQYFQGWGWPRYPTRQELWAMSYLALIHGANGITWYTYGGWGDNHGVTDNPEVWGNICELAKEISALQSVLLEPACLQPTAPEVITGPAQDALGHPSISVLLKLHQGTWYLLAANSANAPVTARFPCAAGKQVALPQENRQIAADGAGFTDQFAPYGVHVYTWQ